MAGETNVQTTTAQQPQQQQATAPQGPFIQQAAQVQQPAVQTPQVQPGENITLTRQEYAAFLQMQSTLNQFTQQQHQQTQQQQQQQVQTVAKTDGIDKALQLATQQHQQTLASKDAEVTTWKTRFLEDRKTTVLSQCLVGVEFVTPVAAQQALNLLAAQFDVSEGPTGEIAVRQKGTLMPAADAVKTLIAGTDFKHFLKASTAGGAGTGNNATLTGQVPVPQGFKAPETEGEKAFAEWWTARAVQHQQGYGSMGLSFGPGFNPFGYGQPQQGQPQQGQPQIPPGFNPFAGVAGGQGAFRNN
jgi:hypothetical protein